MNIEQIINRFIVELEECALQNNVDECDDCIANDNCTYRKEILSAISTLEQLAERMRVRTITEDSSTWPEVGIHVLLYTNFSGYKEAWREGDIWISRNAMASVCTEHVINHHGTWQYLPDWSEG